MKKNVNAFIQNDFFWYQNNSQTYFEYKNDSSLLIFQQLID